MSPSSSRTGSSSSPEKFQGTAELTDSEQAGKWPVRVEAIEGPGKGVSVMLSSAIITVGSDASCELVLADSTVSRKHCTFEPTRSSVLVRDLGSRNGLKYLGAKVREARIPVGSELTVGRTKIRFVALSQAVEEADPPAGLVGRSRAMRIVFAQLQRLVAVDQPVLIEGETGTGKGTIAQVIHQNSSRRREPLVVFECAAANPELIETDLFGHVKGAFSGASHARSGVFEHAGAGTLLLDGLDEFPLSLQPKLLRVLDSKEFMPVGGHKPLRMQCRVIATSSKNLQGEVQAGRFRSDLYFRVAAATLRLPPLRERPEDISQLVKHFVNEAKGVEVALAPATLAAFQCGRWPGNVRELRSALQAALTLGEPVAEEGTDQAGSYATARDEMLKRFERDYLAALLEVCKRDVDAAAAKAKLSRRQLYRLLAKHRLVRRVMK